MSLASIIHAITLVLVVAMIMIRAKDEAKMRAEAEQALRKAYEASRPQLPRMTVMPCDEPGFEGYASVSLGPCTDAMRVALRHPDGTPTPYGMQALRLLKQLSDPDRPE